MLAGQQPALRFRSPAAGQTITGSLHLALAGDLSKVATVEYRIGDYRIALRTSPPFSLDWNSALAGDGNHQIEAIARDAFGAIVSDGVIPLVFQNYGCKGEVVNGLPATLSGSVPLTLHAFDPQHFPAYWEVAIDGELVPPRYTDQTAKNDVSITESLDTTIYPNGVHEFSLAVHSNDYGVANPVQGNENYRGTVMQNVDIENGRTFMEPIANYLHVYTQVGGGVAVGCVRAYTNGDRDACLNPQFSAADPTVISLDAAGNLKALREGYTDVTVSEGGKSTVAHVWVRNSGGIPHFTQNGGFSSTYTEGQSQFIVAPYGLAAQAFGADSRLLAEVRRAGVNTLTRGVYINPTDLTTTYPDWKQGVDALILPDYRFAAANGFRTMGSGDDMARNIGAEAWRSLNWPPAKQAIQYAVQQFAIGGSAVSLEMIDEASFLWGPNPQPAGLLGAANSMQSIACAGAVCTVTWPGLSENSWHDSISAGLTFTLTGNAQLNTPAGRFYTVTNVTGSTFDFVPATPVTGTFTPQNSGSTEFQWFARATTCSGSPCAPPVLNSAIATVTSWVKSAPATVAVSYPAGGVAQTPVQRNWMGVGSPSDYASHYWDTNQQRPTYVFGKGIREAGYFMLSSFYNRQPYMRLDRPQIMLIGLSANSFIKGTPAGSADYNPPGDQLQYVGTVPKTVASSMLAVAAAGASGLRLYQFEDMPTYQSQKAAGPGSGIQTAAAPAYGAVDLWRSMGYAANLLTKVLQPYLLGMPLNSPALGRNIVTGARQAAAGRMLIIVNGSDGARQVSVDFRPYQLGNGAVRYRVNDTYIKTATVAAGDGETVQMESGETVVYLFSASSAAAALETVAFQPPSLAAGTRVALRYGYVFQQDTAGSGDTVECTAGCAIAIDRRIGDVFVQYTLVDPQLGIVQESEPALLRGAGTITIPPTLGPRRTFGIAR